MRSEAPKPVAKVLFTYPPLPQRDGIPVTNEDVECLNERTFLNDAIINFYLKFMFHQKLLDRFRGKTHIFSTYFFARLDSKIDKSKKGEDGSKTVKERRHSLVKRWTRHIDIFEKNFIIIPINQNDHWFLAIICYPGHVPDAPPPSVDEKANKTNYKVTSTNDQDEIYNSVNKDQTSNADGTSICKAEESPDSEEPLPEVPDVVEQHQIGNETPCIYICNSLRGRNDLKIADMLREYLEMEWRMKKGTRKIFDTNTIQGCILECPKQKNYFDCGVYLLQYVESFFENPIPYFGNPMPDLKNWFPESKVVNKRQEIKDLILNLQNEQSPSSAS